MSRHENLTIMFTDVVGFTRLTSRLSRADMRQLMQVHDRTVLPIVNAYGGQKIKSIGDAFLIGFRSPTDAVLCGMAIQDAVAEQRAGAVPDLHLRVALSAGDVRVERGDVFGEAVNVASRIESLTPPDAVYFSESVYLAMSKADLAVDRVGEQQLRGIPDPVIVYRAQPVNTTDGALPFGGVHTRRAARPSVVQRLRAVARSAWVTRSALAGRRAVLAVAGAAGAGAAAVALTVLIASLGSGELTPPIGEVGAVPHAQPERLPDDAPRASAGPATHGDPSAWYAQALQLFQDDARDALHARLAAAEGQAGLRAHARLLQGHMAYRDKAAQDALAHYRAAIDARPALADDPMLAANTIAQLSQYTADVESLIRAHPSESLVAALARRSGEPGFFGRHHAVRILERLGMAQQVRWFDYAVEEIRGRSACEDRLEAVNILGELGDPAAIPILEEARGSGVGGWLENRCLRGAAKAWIKRLEAQS